MRLNSIIMRSRCRTREVFRGSLSNPSVVLHRFPWSGNHHGWMAPVKTMDEKVSSRREGTRTPDILLPKQARYQLRYTPNKRHVTGFEPATSDSRGALVGVLTVSTTHVWGDISPWINARVLPLNYTVSLRDREEVLEPLISCAECWWWDLNPHVRRQQILSLSRLPIPSHQQMIANTYMLYVLAI